jgi:hypothetical protein
MKAFLAFSILVSIVLFSCKKENFTNSPEARVSFSADSLYFDTLISNTGSVTKSFKIFNLNDQKLRLSSVALAGGNNSSFRININGLAANEASGIEMQANDSIYVFVSVIPKSSGTNQPLIAEDSIKIQYNGNTAWIKLSAWGQDAVFLNKHVLLQDETWSNEKPYVIIGGLHVPEGKKLTIEKGTRIYCRADSPLIVDGSLDIRGEYYDSTKVIFRSDRLDVPYRDYPGSWPGIIVKNGTAKIHGADIRNAYQGIVAQNSIVEIDQSIIDNCFDEGILSVGSEIRATNLLVSNCGKGIILANGGDHEFIHCTITGISNNYVLHKEPSVLITDFIREDDQLITNDTRVSFINSIIWGANGTIENELVLSRASNKLWEIEFSNNLIGNVVAPVEMNSFNNIFNTDPEFEEINTEKRIYNFRLKEISPLLDKGKPTAVQVDLEGKSRNASTPDPGVYERN